jgi:hypothetical protein
MPVSKQVADYQYVIASAVYRQTNLKQTYTLGPSYHVATLRVLLL